MTEYPTFEELRRTYFINPGAKVDARYPESASFIASQLLGQPELTTNLQKTEDPFTLFIQDMTLYMRGSRRFNELSMGQIHPDGFAPAILSHIASTLRNNNTIIQEVSPRETVMEEEAISWLIKEICGYNTDEASGALVTGGTTANLTALLIAREQLIRKSNWDGKRPALILTSEMSHYSVQKAAQILAPCNLIQVKDVSMEEYGFRMDVDKLEEQLTTMKRDQVPIMAIVATAGQTETGVVEPLQSIADLTKHFGIYLHIDAAYGGPFRLTRREPLFYGIENSDSVTIDPHKYLYTPYPGGAVLFSSSRTHSLIGNFNREGQDYMFKSGTAGYLGGRRIEGSMGGQGAAATWSVIKTLGKNGLRAILEHNLEVTDYTFRQIEDSDLLENAFIPQLNTICFYPNDPRLDSIKLYNPDIYRLLIEKTRGQLEESTGIYISTTTLHVPKSHCKERRKTAVFRVVPTNPYTEFYHIDMMLDQLQNLWDQQVVAYLNNLD